MTPEERLERAEAPDAAATRERARRVVIAAPVASAPRRRRWLPIALVVVVAGAIPTGEAIASWLANLVDPPPPKTAAPPPEPRLAKLPAAGRVLVSGPGGAWSIGRDGARIRLGDYNALTWSPRGVFAAAATDDALRAITPDGGVRWTVPLDDGPVAELAWSPSGYRIAYSTGSDVRVVAGDGSDDHALLRRVATSALAWRPGAGHELAVGRRDGAIELYEADTGVRRWRLPSRLGDEPVALLWRSDRELVVVRRFEILLVRVRRGSARVAGRFTIDGPVTAATLADDRLVLAAGAEVSTRRLRRFNRAAKREPTAGQILDADYDPLGPPRARLTAAGPVSDLVASPRGDKLLVASAAADQWVFLPLQARKRTTAVTVRGFIDVADWETAPVASLGLADGRRIVITAEGREGSCLVISGVDEYDRGCGTHWVSPAELQAGPVVQRSADHPVEVYGAVKDNVARVGVTYEVDGVALTRDATIVEVDDQSVPYGYYLAELPPTARNIEATAYDAAGSALESDLYGASYPQAFVGPRGRLRRYEGTPWAPDAPAPISPVAGDPYTSFEVSLPAPRRERAKVVYTARAVGGGGQSTPCRRDALSYFPPVPAAGAVMVAHLQPAGEGAHLGWCPGDYRGTVSVDGKRVIERFAFRVLP